MRTPSFRPVPPIFGITVALFFLSLPACSPLDISRTHTHPHDPVPQAEEQLREVEGQNLGLNATETEVEAILGEDEIYIPEEAEPVVVRREKGAEPHPRFGYDAALTNNTPPKTRHKIFQYMPDSSALGTESMLAELSQEVAGKIFYELKEEGLNNLSAKVAVVGAVPLSDLKRESEFGRMVAEYYLTDLADRGIQVTELRMGSDINILPQTGEFLLSRNIGEIANNTPALDYVVVSTYTNTRKTLILQGRLISLKTGLVKTSWRYNLPFNRELLSLFDTTDQQPFTIAVKGIGH